MPRTSPPRATPAPPMAPSRSRRRGAFSIPPSTRPTPNASTSCVPCSRCRPISSPAFPASRRCRSAPMSSSASSPCTSSRRTIRRPRTRFCRNGSGPPSSRSTTPRSPPMPATSESPASPTARRSRTNCNAPSRCPPARPTIPISTRTPRICRPTSRPAKQLGAEGAPSLWNPVPPYARLYLATAKNGLKAGTQISRCWQIYKLTQQLNAQWQAKLRAVGSVFANYMLVGTQWGAAVEAPHPPTTPPGAVPGLPVEQRAGDLSADLFPAGRRLQYGLVHFLPWRRDIHGQFGVEQSQLPARPDHAHRHAASPWIPPHHL